MAVLINLLPEARMSKLRDKKRRQLVFGGSILIILTTAALLVTLVVLIGLNTAIKFANDGTITGLKKDVAAKQDLEQSVATIQEHLASAATLNTNRLYVSQIFSTLVKTLPKDVTLTSLSVGQDYACTASGKAGSFASVGLFNKALEQYNVDFKPAGSPSGDSRALFSDVQISSTARGSDTGANSVTFSMKFIVDREVVANQNKLSTK